MPNFGAAKLGISAVGLFGKKKSGGGGRAQSGISKEQLELARNIYADYKEFLRPLEIEQVQAERDLVPLRKEAIEDYINSGLENREFYEQVYLPVEREFAQQALDGVADRTDFLTSRAATEVDKQFDNQRDRTRRNYERQGLDDPNSGQNAGLTRGYDVAQAAARADQVNNTRINEERRVEDTNFTRLGSATSAGAGLRRSNQPTTLPRGNFSSTPSSAGNVLGGASASASGASSANYRQNEANARDTAGSLYGLGRTASGVFNSGGGGGGNYYGTTAGGSSVEAAEAGGLFNFSGGDYTDDFGYADGGEVNAPNMPQQPAYGLVRGPGTGTSDSVPATLTNDSGQTFDAQLSNGEYVIPEKVVREKGVEFFNKLVEKVFNNEGMNQNSGLNRNQQMQPMGGM